MVEFWDLYDENRLPLRRTHRRGKPLKDGEYHIVVFVWIFNGRGELLLTKRAPQKKTYPNFWAVTGGAVLAGETSLHAVARELREETGICAEMPDFVLLGSERDAAHFCFRDTYLLIRDVPLSEIVLQKGETCGARWVDRRGFERMSARGEIAAPDIRRYQIMRDKLAELF